jgi:type VI secretion system protein
MRGLFERLERGARELDEARSIAAHLAVLFDARQGGADGEARLGRPDLTDLVHTWPEGVRAIERALVALVERFEPRLEHVEVRAARSPDPLVLAWEVRGRSRASGRAHRFVTEVDSYGHARVR